MTSRTRHSSILFGAFDRHNFGDLLFPHLMTDLLPDTRFEFAGLANRDLRERGGHRVHALVKRDEAPPVNLIHVGGELLTCSAWQAAVMLLDPTEAVTAIERYDNVPTEAAAWAARQLATTRRMPYVVGRDGIASSGRLIFNAVGGVEWPFLTASQREEVTQALKQADWISVRDQVTQSALQAEGIEVPLCPDPAVMVAHCFGDTIRQHQQLDAVKSVTDAFPQGYLVCQFSADFGDDATLTMLARQLSRVVSGTGFGLVLFSAGTAPWHDDPALYEKLQHLLPTGTARVFDSLHLWDICALIAASRGMVGSSLHSRLVALAYGLPRVSLVSPQQGTRPEKVAAFAGTWEPDEVPRGVAVSEVEAAVEQALALPTRLLAENADRLSERYRQSLAQWSGLLTHAA